MDKDSLISHYEQLRAQALGKLFPSSQGLGLALFMRKGMTVWSQTWSEHTPEVKPKDTMVLDCSKIVPENISGKITTMLTNMIMNLNRKESENGFTCKSESNTRSPATQSLPLCAPIVITSGSSAPGKQQASVCA
jgi:hypothetical protein